MVIVDTSFLLAFFDKSDSHHAQVAAALQNTDGPFVVSPYVVAEVDYLVLTRIGVHAEIGVLRELATAWVLAELPDTALREITDIVEKYREEEIGVADASIVWLAEQNRTKTVGTLDLRHFGVLRTVGGEALEIIP
jgi:predicted nucleic acid-binding protein